MFVIRLVMIYIWNEIIYLYSQSLADCKMQKYHLHVKDGGPDISEGVEQSALERAPVRKEDKSTIKRTFYCRMNNRETNETTPIGCCNKSVQ